MPARELGNQKESYYRYGPISRVCAAALSAYAPSKPCRTYLNLPTMLLLSLQREIRSWVFRLSKCRRTFDTWRRFSLDRSECMPSIT